MLEFGAAPLINVPQVIRHACASLGLGLKQFAGGFVTYGFVSSTSKLSTF